MLLDRYNATDVTFPDETTQLFRDAANGTPGSNPTLGVVSNSSAQPIACFNIQNTLAESVWVNAAPVACSPASSAPPLVQSFLCGLDARFEPAPDATLSSTCGTIPNIGTVEQAYTQDTDLVEEDIFTSYSGNGRRLITVPIVDTMTPASMTILGFRQFLIQPNVNTQQVLATDVSGRFLAMYVGNVAPVKQGSFGNCGVTAGPGKVVLHQ